MDTVANRVWHPPEGVTRHAGTPIPEDLEFFAAPPPEIGAVITANSTLTPALQPMPTAKRIGISVGIGVGF